jgi:hypothetical protein
MTKLRVTFHCFENASKNTKPSVLVFTGIMLVFLDASCQGDEMAEGDMEDAVCGQRRRLIALPSSASLYTPCCIRK